MPAPYRKKLIEVALPLEAINVASAREKSIRHGHPSTLHLWWARRPLAACRAVLFASLVDDPDSDPQFRRPDGSPDEDAAGTKRAELFSLIEELVRWENSNNPEVINRARAEIARCVASRKIELGELAKDQIIHGPQKGQKHPKGPVSGAGVTAWEVLLRKARPEVVNAFLAEHAPPVLDPFCGGGSIPLEAQRLGLRAYASDLNPVPVLITKALIEIPPKFAGRPPVNPDWQKKSASQKAATVWEGAKGLAEDVRYYGQWMRDEAEKRIGHLYPKVKITAEMAKDRPDLAQYVDKELVIIAWLWARSVPSPNPVCKGMHVPLIHSYWLSTKKGKEAYIEPVIDRKKNTYRFEVRSGVPASDFDPSSGTQTAKATFACIFSGDTITGQYADNEANAGRMSKVPIAIVVQGEKNRIYLSFDLHESDEWVDDSVTDVDILGAPARGTFAGNAQGRKYGFSTFGDYFTPRQRIMLGNFSSLVAEAIERVFSDSIIAELVLDDLRLDDGGSGCRAYSQAVGIYLAFGVSKAADYNSSLVSWITQRDQARSTFSKQSLSMAWDFCEVNPLVGAAGDPSVSLDGIADVLERLVVGPEGQVVQLDATAGCEQRDVIASTYPPYYDNIGYADLSDFFYVWLRQPLSAIYPSSFATLLTPKTQELIASPYRHEGSKERARDFFETGLRSAFDRLRERQQSGFPLTVYYAFKQAESDEEVDSGDDASRATVSTGWDTMLSGLHQSGFCVGGTWPIRTERGARSVGIGTNALASSIVLVCRLRPRDAPLATRKEFLTALRRELPEALRNLQRGNIAPVDLAQAAIGPGMAVFTRYSRVMETDGSPMTVRTALGLINQSLDEVLAEQEGEFDGDTRWALAWFEQFGMEEGPFGTAETLSRAKNTAINGLVEAGIVVARAGKVRLVRRDELSDDWNPAADRRLTIWETTQHLIRRLDQQGETGTAALLHQVGGMGDTARDLAYRLYTLCERKKWAEEALAYNGLVIAWPELTKLAMSQPSGTGDRQREMFED